MAITLNSNKIFSLFNGLIPNKTDFQFSFRNGIDQDLCDLHIAATSSLPGIPPVITKIKIQTTFDAKTVILSTPTSELDVDIRAFFGGTQCIPSPFPQNLFFVTLYFDRPFIENDQLQIAPSNSQGIIDVA